MTLFEQEIGPDGLQRFLPISTALGFGEEDHALCQIKKMQNADLTLQQLLKNAEENWFYLTLRQAMLLGERREECGVELR